MGNHHGRKSRANHALDGAAAASHTHDGVTKSATSRHDTATSNGPDVRGLAELFGHQVKSTISNSLSQSVSKPAGDLASLAKALRFSAQQLEGNLSAPYLGKVADKLDDVSKLISESDPRDAVASIERFARREPAIFAGAALLLGIGGARFLKSSARRSDLS